MKSTDINPNWGSESTIAFVTRADNFVYEVVPPITEIEYQALMSTGLLLGVSIDSGPIDPDGESIVMPIIMDSYKDGKAVASPLKVSGESSPINRMRHLNKIAGALTVMRN